MIPAPHLEYDLMLPILIMMGAAVIGILLEAALPRAWRSAAQVTLALVGVIGALAASVWVFTQIDPAAAEPKPGFVAALGSLAIDGPAVVGWIVVLVFGLLTVLLFAERRLEVGVSAFAGQASALPGTEAEKTASQRRLEQTEIYPLLLFALTGMLILPASSDLLTMFIGLEIVSLPLYLLCGMARRRRLLSQEAAMKYFLLGAFSSGFFIYGIALVYGFAGSMDLANVAHAVLSTGENQGLLLLGMGLIGVGLLFKIGAVPFHAWTPDVYQGAPTPVTAFMAAGTKLAAFMALMRVFYVAFGEARWDWSPMILAVAIATMLVGSIMALTQTDVKRILAYSSIAHAGFLLVGMLGTHQPDEGIGSVQAVLFYLIAYGLTTMAAFALVALVRDSGGETSGLNQWAGLGKTSPVTAGVFAFLLLGMAGIPLTSGFTSKWAVFAAALSGGQWLAVVVGIAASAIALYLYLRVIAVMYFSTPSGQMPSVVVPSPLTGTVIAFGVGATLLLGIVPGPLLDVLGGVAEFVR